MNLGVYYDGPYGPHMYGDYWGWGWLMMLLMLGLAGLFIYMLIRAIGGNGKDNSALDEAKKRFAKGEITKKQLDEIRKELKKD